MDTDINDIVDYSLIQEIRRKREYRNRAAHGEFGNVLPIPLTDEISVESHILLATILYQIKEIKKIDKLLYIDGTEFFQSAPYTLWDPTNFLNREIFLNKISHDYVKVRSPQDEELVQEADLIFGQFPFGNNLPKEFRNIVDIPGIDVSNRAIIDYADTISKDGMGVFLTLGYHRTFQRDDLRKHLSNKGFFVNGIINLPKDFLQPQTSIQPLLILVSRAKTDKEFILNIDSSTTYNFNLGNLFSKIDSDDISIGCWVSPDDFHGFEALELSKELNSLGGDYSGFSTFSLDQISKEINLVKTGGEFEDKEDTVYLPLRGIQEAATDIADIPIKHQNIVQLVVDNTRVIPEYLCSFFNSKLGKALLKIEKEGMGRILPRMTKSQLCRFPLRIPELSTQEKVVANIRKYRIIKESVDKLGDNLTLNPVSDTDTTDTIDSVMSSLSKLSGRDLIAELIRRGESKTTEFKETFCFDIRTKKREAYITDGIVKTIAAFLNTDGGSLLVGVSDSKEITGMKDEMEKFFKQGGPDLEDNLMKHLKNLLKARIGEEFYPYVDTELVPIESDYVLKVDCKPSDKEVFVSQKEFYVRTNPATDRLEGRTQSEYIKRRFWRNQEVT